MAAEPAYLACDWGTTSLRAWVLDKAGAVALLDALLRQAPKPAE